MKRKKMDFAVLSLGLIGPLLFAAGLALPTFTENRTFALWIGSAGVAMVILALTLNLQQRIWESDASKSLSPEAAAERIILVAQAKMQRAWLSVRPQLAGEISGGKPIDIELVVENVGREPATGVSHHGMTMMFDMPEQIGYAPQIWSADFAQVIRLECDLAVPQKGKTTIFPGNKPVLKTRWDKTDDVAALIDGKKILVTYGCLGYFTGGATGHTWYCFYLMRDKSGGWALGSAPIGNDAD